MTQGRQAIIDIGSNSIRLVVYDGPARAPATLFNEKVSAGLGSGLASSGSLEPKAMRLALRALARFKAVIDAMGIMRVRTVATAAVRDASDGAAFIARVEALGLAVETLSGEQEARGAGLGVLSALPQADGIVGDLGGGSLELVRVQGGAVVDCISLPLGVLRLPALRRGPRGSFDRHVARLLAQAPWLTHAHGLPFYLVGGSWRALARLHMYLTDYPLPVLHGYAMPPEAAVRLMRAAGRVDRKRLKAIGLSTPRITALGDAGALLAVLARQLETRALIVSAFGLREGLLYADLDPGTRAQDPLIAATRAAGALLGRFAEHGDLLARWIAPLFEAEDAESHRLRHAACLLADVAWAASPELRGARGVEMALDGNWVGVDARGRAMIAQALFASFGGGPNAPTLVAQLCAPEDVTRATGWGLAMRLGQRLSGGVAEPLAISRLRLGEQLLCLDLPPLRAALYGEAVERRHKQLAASLGRDAQLTSAAA